MGKTSQALERKKVPFIKERAFLRAPRGVVVFPFGDLD
ncbi:hypothetical protein TRICHSKD4_2524 [Roseibium sp. TrichSKD4]|nr:hypothetical protein TRICHSKD4_2524 [Roseibium sp. TrichSKD4]